MGLFARLRLVQRCQGQATERRVREAEQEHASRNGGGAAPPGLLARAAAQIKAEVAEQYAHEVKELKKQIAEQKKELRARLKAS